MIFLMTTSVKKTKIHVLMSFTRKLDWKAVKYSHFGQKNPNSCNTGEQISKADLDKAAPYLINLTPPTIHIGAALIKRRIE